MLIVNLKIPLILLLTLSYCSANDVLGCGGFVKSHATIDFSKIEVKLYTKQGNVKDSAFCAPNNGYYFVPLYDIGEYVLKIHPPAGWSFKPQQIELNIDGKTDICSRGGDINFIFEGFGITGKVDNYKGSDGPSGVNVKLIDGNKIGETVTTEGGNFYFTPVYPGRYTLVASHPKWTFKKDKIVVKVATGNTELPNGSLIVSGYDVYGSVIFENKPLSDINFILFSESDHPVEFKGCSTKDLISFTSTRPKLCHVTSSSDGVFTFPSLSFGQYLIIPFFEEENVKYHMVPKEMKFNVTTSSVKLTPVFEVTGFSVKGHVFTNVDGKSVPGATVTLNEKRITETNNDGSFLLENLVAGTYKLVIEKPGLRFEKEELKISTKLNMKAEFYPSEFQVCGNVASETSYHVVIKPIEYKTKPKQDLYSVETDAGTGDFCIYLPPGKYSARVKEKVKEIQFFPVEQTFSLIDHPHMGLFFSQLKAIVSGKVKCLKPKDCHDLIVNLNLEHDVEDTEEVKYVVPVDENNSYLLPNVVPGTYIVSLEQNKFCWEKDKQTVVLNSEKITVPDFVQTGYIIKFVASHQTQLEYTAKGSRFSKQIIKVNIKQGENKICVAQAGVYEFIPNSCHIYASGSLIYDTETSTSPLNLTPIKHLVTMDIKTDEVFKDLKVKIDIGDTITEQGPLKYTKAGSSYYYKVNIHLAEKEEAVITPSAELLWFQPSSYRAKGTNDCVDLGMQIHGLQGILIQGKTAPALENVEINVKRSNGDIMITHTDSQGKYKLPTMDASYHYTVTATKESYYFTGPDANGLFRAHKLAEIVVQVVDDKGIPLQGGIISLSGAESYRSNLQTNKEGIIRFTSLSPSDYFLRPMMKEYKFDPPSKMISVKEGVTVNVKLSGKRVAYSAYGVVSTLSGEPEQKMIVIATGIDNCAQNSEETISEENGQFRIRGLKPGCKYEIRIKHTVDDLQIIKKSLPDFVPIQVQNDDVHGIKLVVIHQVQNMDMIAHITSPDPDTFKTVRVKVYRESNPNTPVFNVKLDSSLYTTKKLHNPGVLVHFPSIPADNKIYYIRIESVVLNTQGHVTDAQFFNANSSFKFFHIDFNPNANHHEHHIGQTSNLALPFLVVCVIMFYNIDKISAYFMDLLKRFEINNPLFQRVGTVATAEKSNNEDIDELVQNINAPKRKTKVRKI